MSDRCAWMRGGVVSDAFYTFRAYSGNYTAMMFNDGRLKQGVLESCVGTSAFEGVEVRT